MRCLISIAIVLAGLGPLSANATTDFADVDLDKACPAAAREEARLLSSKFSAKETIAITRPALRQELLDMERRDQQAREIFIAGMHQAESSDDDSRWLPVQQVDNDNLRMLKHIFAQDGFPSIDMVGVDGVGAAFVLVQHADSDPEFQEAILRIVKVRLPAGEISGSEFALLTDRVLTAKGQPQRYGTQFEQRDGDFKPRPIADAAHVDRRRHALGMISLANYDCQIHAMYGNPAGPAGPSN